MKIAIIGGGFAGITTALSLEGHEVSLFEKAKQFTAVGAGIMLQPLGMEVLQRLGLKKETEKVASKINRFKGVNEHDKWVLDLDFKPAEGNHGSYGIHRPNLHHLMVQTLYDREGFQLFLNHEVEEIKDNQIITNKGEHKGFDVIVVANGSKSSFRASLPGDKFEKPYPWAGLWGILENTNYQDVLYQRYRSNQNIVGLMPCGLREMGSDTEILGMFWSLRVSDYETLKKAGINAFKASILSLDKGLEPVTNQLNDFDQMIFAPYMDVKCQNWHVGNVIFIGDAVHAMSPQLSLGTNLAMLDGYLLGKILNKSSFKIEDLALLREVRIRQSNFYHYMSRLLTACFQHDRKAWAILRDFTWPLLAKWVVTRNLMIDTPKGEKRHLFDTMKANKQVAYYLSKLR